MKKYLITFIVLLALPLSAIAEKAVFIAKGYNYTRKADRKAFVADPAVGSGVYDRWSLLADSSAGRRRKRAFGRRKPYDMQSRQ